MLTILGGGPAGLAAGFYSRHSGRPFRILEAADRVGGNCITEERNGFRFDRGAHRLHDKDPDITADLLALMGDEIVRVSAPSAVCTGGRFLRFPPSPRDLLAHLGPRRFAGAAAGALLARVTPTDADTFESFAIRAYGPAVARLFLLNYSEKLWGRPCAELSPRVSGGRLRGLQLSTLFTPQGPHASHLDGSFYYPARGYGRLVERIADVCGPDTIRCGARVTRLLHDGDRLTHVEVNGAERLPVERVAATLPLSTLVRSLDPRPPEGILALADHVTFRHVALVTWLLARPSVTPYATVYFPEPTTPITRVSEPRNRSPLMAPPNHTSLVAELPCGETDALWHATDDEIVQAASPALTALGWLRPDEVTGVVVVRLPHAYPVLTIEAERAAADLMRYLGRFRNLHLLGRNGLFHYGWLHTMMRMAKTLVAELPHPTVARG